jgi:hypothetical protein
MSLLHPFLGARRRLASAIAGCALAAALLLPAAPSLAQQAVISFAEQPLRLIRKTTVYQASSGVRLQAGDIVESIAQPSQIEWPNGARLALGPASSVLVRNATDLPGASLLRGWAKFATTAPAGGRLSFDAGTLGVQAQGASGIVHLTADRTELLVESGTVAAADKAAGAAPAPIGNGQYAVRQTAGPFQTAPRPPRQFIGQMPRAFLDPLVAVAALAPGSIATAEREIAAADIAAWRDAGADVRQRLASQIAARLADGAFRAQAESLLDNQPEWRAAMRRRDIIRSRTATPLNHLF